MSTMPLAAPSKLAFWLQTDSQAACEIGRLAGFDMVIFDVEHGVFSEPSLDRLVPFCSALGLEAYVRVAESTQPNVQAALDMGASGVILPQIKDVEHAKAVTSFAKFPPRGRRGIGFSRTSRFSGATAAFVDDEDRKRLCYAMIETPGALGDATRIAALDCVDGLFIGPGDLSITRGRGTYGGTAADLSDLRAVAEAARGANKLFAAAAPDVRFGKEAIAAGARFIAVADELSAMAAGFAALRADYV